MDKKLTYLVCPLNWGLGHASRMIPIIYDLLNKGHKVILGGDGNALSLISKEFPQLNTINIPDVNIHFSSKIMLFNLVALIPKFIISSIKEHRLLANLININAIDVIISDNRYGLWNKNIKSIFVTHQLMVKLPKPLHVFELFIHKIIKNIVLKYDECWVPDYPDKQHSLCGDLAYKYKVAKNVKFIGPLSRFKQQIDNKCEKKYDIVLLLSGPEPTRTELENKFYNILYKTSKSVLIIQGKPQKNEEIIQKENLNIVSHLSTNRLKNTLQNTKLIICRSGYSTIMDLENISTKTLFIPTPGQTEQEYLAKYLSNRYSWIIQKNIDRNFLDFIDFLD